MIRRIRIEHCLNVANTAIEQLNAAVGRLKTAPEAQNGRILFNRSDMSESERPRFFSQAV